MRRALILTLAGVLAAACSNETPTPTIPAGPPPTTAAATPSASPTFGDQTRNQRGNLVKSIGQAAAFTDDVDGVTIEFRVDGIRQNAKCQAQGYTDRPDNGQFLALDIFARTTPAYDPSRQDTEFLAAGYTWSVVTADGMRHSVDTGPAWGCSPSSRKNLGGLRPAVTVTGTVYLDAPADLTGAVVVLSPVDVTTGGWEWVIPA